MTKDDQKLLDEIRERHRRDFLLLGDLEVPPTRMQDRATLLRMLDAEKAEANKLTPDDRQTNTIPGRPDRDLLEWAVMHAGLAAAEPATRWAHVGALLGLGSTSASTLCQRFNVDPDERIGGCPYCCEEP